MKKYAFASVAVFSILLMTSSTLFAAGGDIGLSTEPLTDGSAAWPYLAEDFDGTLFIGNPECVIVMN